ncbi:anthranilate synthase family protein [Ornithinimicrobium tianjinense]|uniref:anthranilate synthase n=1 Tax=Ornithinimicrobium tianjinense TaxID=1195761 RepID=A0A917BU50_9MICO|nr:anthranilate synthase family protein [Ornithinimicrobium tianjinense]GGF56923.1 phenazine-specific anthranilate synthase component I [Ornithinimicrobium tianjinense]
MPQRLLDQILADPSGQSWAVLLREGRAEAEVIVGEVVDLELLRDLPRPLTGAPVLALVPYRQITERGFDAHDDGTPLRVLRPTDATAYRTIPVADLVAALPTATVAVTDERFSVSDEDYEATVARVIEEEIGNGEGANFVIRRDVVARTDADPATAALTWLRTLLTDERGAYWTFAVHTPGHTLVGATPERHVSVRDGRVWMNPISGTFRHPQDPGPEGAVLRESFASFIRDTKETEELFMVVDEEMKMMAQICSDGGRITGPSLKQMAHLTHTEYLLDGSSESDVRDVLRATMFAPTVTGSPMENACTVIQRHEPDGRGYYSGVLALLDLDEEGGERLDAPILIRTAHVDDAGTITVSAGATLVRHSDPRSEGAETSAKARGVLAALGLRPRRELGYDVQLALLPGVAEDLAARNETLSPFWLAPQESRPDPLLAGRRVLVVDAEDTWTQMLAHMVRHVGMAAEVRRWEGVSPADVVDPAWDLVLCGPGPGDPTDLSDPRIARLRDLLAARLDAGLPLLAVCLSHQVLAAMAGLEIAKLDRPNQGVQIPVDLWGTVRRIGFYNTFVARPPAPGTQVSVAGRPLEVAVHAPHDAVVGLRGPGLATIQGHAESVLSRDGLVALHGLLSHAVHG